MDDKKQKYFNDIPDTPSHVSLKLEDIQRRCVRLLEEESGDELELALEEPELPQEGGNPYDHS